MGRNVEVINSLPGRNGRTLTNRELQIMGEVASGKTNLLIGSSLGIREQTVKNHVAHVLAKLSVPDRTSAVVRLIQTGTFNPGSIKINYTKEINKN